MILLHIDNLSPAEKAGSLFGAIFLIIAIVLWIYGSFHAILFDDEMKKINPKHDPFRSIHVNFNNRFRLGLPIPIIDKAENDLIKKYKTEYNRINISFWIFVLLSIIIYNI